MSAKSRRERRGRPAAAARPPGKSSRAGQAETRRRWNDAAWCLLAVGLALLVQRRALGNGFGPDDLILLEHARGLTPWAPGPWRWLSGPVFWTTGLRLLGADAEGWHVVVWLLHGAVVATLFAVARALRASRLVAFAAAVWFGTHRLLWDALLPISSVGEVLAALLVLVSALTLYAARRWRAAAWVAFPAALLCKESVAMVPLAFAWAPEPDPPRSRTWPWFVVGGAAGMGFLLWLRITGQAPAGPAYVTAVGPNVFTQLLAYTAAATDFTSVIPDLWSPSAVPRSLAALAVLIGVAVAAFRKTRLPWIGIAGFLTSLGPVLLLRETRHLHYLYAPLAFLALALAGSAAYLLDSAANKITTGIRQREWLMAFGLLAPLAGHAISADQLLRDRMESRVPQLGLPSDPLLRKMVVARNALASLKPLQEIGDTCRVVVIHPEADQRTFDIHTGRQVSRSESSHRYNLLAAVLDEGRAVTAVYPRILETRFAFAWSPEFAGWWLATPHANGQLEIQGRGAEGEARLVETWRRAGLVQAARALVDSAEATGGGRGESRPRLDQKLAP